jgi:hypothetical protein
MHPEGIEVTEADHAAALARTQELLSRERVTIFEAAIAAGDLFVRVDILRKDGTTVELIEVKAKSYDPADTEFFVGKNGGFKPAMLPYLQDIAFQRYVFGLAFPDLAAGTSSFLMLADKSKVSTVEQLSDRNSGSVASTADLWCMWRPAPTCTASGRRFWRRCRWGSMSAAFSPENWKRPGSTHRSPTLCRLWPTPTSRIRSFRRC